MFKDAFPVGVFVGIGYLCYVYFFWVLLAVLLLAGLFVLIDVGNKPLFENKTKQKSKPFRSGLARRHY